MNCPPVLSTHRVPDSVVRQRLSDYLCGIFPQLPSRNSVKKALKKGAILLNGRRAFTGDWAEPSQIIDLLKLEQAPQRAFKLPLEVIAEDDYLAVVIKPAGYPVSGTSFQTIEQALPFNLTPSTAVDASAQPRVVHRLDVPTSGLLLVSKTRSARMHLGAQFEAKTIQKRYQALVVGQPKSRGSISTPVDDKAAYTRYECLRTVPSLRNHQISLMDLYPKTGRTHQLRRHLAGIGHPILGDGLYGKEGQVMKHKGLFLRAVEIHFNHPKTELRQLYHLPTPHKFNALLEREQRRYQQYYS